ncbi:MAG: PQQ-like beta-propeller repeat protein, partial [Planctomycetes bacterium]|nr:PQQ-like beta-propeller repeat protein [Planctomycetota bacterium]
MTPPPTQRCGAFLGLCAALLCTSVVTAQQRGASQGKFATATLPESNEALLYSSRVEAAIQAGDYRPAVELIERLMDLPAGLVAAPASRTYYPVWRQAFRLQAQFPEAGVELYRQLYDAEVSARFGQAASRADVGALRELFYGYRLSTAWPAIGAELTAHLLDQGAYGEAIAVLRELTPRGDRSGAGDAVIGVPEQKAQLAVALAGAGAFRPARRLLDELRSEVDVEARPAWGERLEQLERWFTALRGEGAGSAAEVREPLTPCIEAGAVWCQALAPKEGEPVSDDSHDIADAVDALRRLPVQQPVATEDLLVVRLHGRVYALDAETLVPRWSVTERLSGASGGMPGAVWGTGPEDDVRLSPEAESLLSNHLGHVVSVGFGKVYSVEGLGSFDADLGMFGQRPFRAAREASGRNELVARDLESGRVVWRTTAEAASPLYDVAFQNVPLVVGDSLVAPVQRGDDLSLVVLDPADGKLLREVPLVGPPTHFPSVGGRCLIVGDATTLYVCTGNGVIAALAREDLSWMWAAVYPSTLAEHLGQLWWQPHATTVESNIDPPVIADDLLIVAPVDSPEMFALDRFDGRERWRMSRREYPYLIGSLHHGLVVGGREVACLDLSDPASREPRWRSVPMRITGRVRICDERVFVPTREGIVVLDGRNGKVLADQVAATGPRTGRDDRLETGPTTAGRGVVPDRTANLLVAGDTLFSVSPGRVVKYPDLRRVGARYAGEAEGRRVGGEREDLVRAWLDALGGRHEAAFARLQAGSFDDSQLEAARDQLLTYVFLGLAEDASAGEDRLGWLQRASALADSPDSATDLAITIGQALEGSGQLAAALRHYGRMMRQAGVGHVVDRADPDRRVAGWLHAAERIGQARALAPPGSVAKLVEDALSDDDHRATTLQRLWVALEGAPEHDRVGWHLSLQKLSPELKVRYLPRGDLAGLPVELRRRLHLERWDTHVSLGRLAEARSDRAVWEKQFAGSPLPDVSEAQLDGFEPLSADEERDRVDAIDLAFRKLAQTEGEPFTPRAARQWKIERAELLLDLRRPLTGSRPWILTANLEQHRIELINAFKHQHPQRQTEDAMVVAGDGGDASE